MTNDAIEALGKIGPDASAALPRLYEMLDEYADDAEVVELLNTAITQIEDI